MVSVSAEEPKPYTVLVCRSVYYTDPYGIQTCKVHIKYIIKLDLVQLCETQKVSFTWTILSSKIYHVMGCSGILVLCLCIHLKFEFLFLRIWHFLIPLHTPLFKKYTTCRVYLAPQHLLYLLYLLFLFFSFLFWNQFFSQNIGWADFNYFQLLSQFELLWTTLNYFELLSTT